jgi:protein SCO1
MPAPLPSNPPRASGRTVVFVVVATVIAIALPAVAWPLWQAQHRKPQLGDYGVVPAFAFTDQTGATITDDALRGHVTIANLIFTRCTTACPISSMKMSNIQDQTADVANDIKLVSFSVDPGYDTPARLAAYAKRFGAEPARWRFVTGPADAIQKVVGALRMSMDRDGTQADGSPNIMHQPYFVLIDRDARIRNFYDSTDLPRLAILVRDARDLARSTRP